jgi:hypothetical protein
VRTARRIRSARQSDLAGAPSQLTCTAFPGEPRSHSLCVGTPTNARARARAAPSSAAPRVRRQNDVLHPVSGPAPWRRAGPDVSPTSSRVESRWTPTAALGGVRPSWARHVRVDSAHGKNPQRVARSAVSVLRARRGQLRAPSGRATSRYSTHCAITETGATAGSVQPTSRSVSRLSPRAAWPGPRRYRHIVPANAA